ncbi:hypothetical protein N8248_08610, partial [Rhodospirillaceae bacterium]|nr:hypothetical protein [Rhodospirillaceae bacterium]
MEVIPITGYADRFSLQPGEKIDFKVSSTSKEQYSAKLIRVISGDPNPKGPGIIEEDIVSDVTGSYPSRYQVTNLGSYIKIPNHQSFKTATGITIGASIWPTNTNVTDQCIISLCNSEQDAGIAIFIGPNGISVMTADGAGNRTRLNINQNLQRYRLIFHQKSMKYWMSMIGGCDDKGHRND